MFESCLKKQEALIEEFSKCVDTSARYEKIISLGKEQKPLDPQWKTEGNRVFGCQSIVYLHTTIRDQKIYFETEADALISAGLAILLVRVYSGESAETILKCEPIYLQHLGIYTSLTPGRANGLASIHLRMKQEALKALVTTP